MGFSYNYVFAGFFAVIAVCVIFAAIVTMVNFLPMPSTVIEVQSNINRFMT